MDTLTSIKRLGSDRIAICAAPDYLKRCGVPETPADLAQHNCLTYSYATAGDEWRMTGRDDSLHTVKVSGSLRASNGDMAKLAALEGVGLIRQPLFLVGDELRSGRLVEVLTDYHSERLGIDAVYPSRKHLSAKVRVFVDFLTETLRSRASGKLKLLMRAVAEHRIGALLAAAEVDRLVFLGGKFLQGKRRPLVATVAERLGLAEAAAARTGTCLQRLLGCSYESFIE